MSLHERINKTLLLGQSYPGMAAMPGMVWGLPTLPASMLPSIPVSPLSPVSPFLPSWCLQSLILQSQANLLAHHLNINVQNSTLYGKSSPPQPAEEASHTAPLNLSTKDASPDTPDSPSSLIFDFKKFPIKRECLHSPVKPSDSSLRPTDPIVLGSVPSLKIKRDQSPHPVLL